MFNGLRKKGLTKDHCAKINNFSCSTNETIFGNIDEFIKTMIIQSV